MITKLIKNIRKNLKYVVAFIIGCVLTGTVYAATMIAGANVTYSNTNSGLTSTNVTGAINELYEKANTNNNILAAYTYNESGSNKCITGNESTCQTTTCYKTKTSGSCPAGTIIDYQVKTGTIVRFHVMRDTGSVLVMQDQKSTVATSYDWTTLTGDAYSGSYLPNSFTVDGPTVILPKIESATSSWSNVNNKTYTAGTTVLYSNKYTGCSAYNSCTSNGYTMTSRTAKARMITVQEAKALGCTGTSNSCPIWMYNFVSNSTSYGGTENNSSTSDGYWTMSNHTEGKSYVWIITQRRIFYSWARQSFGARAVVEVNK